MEVRQQTYGMDATVVCRHCSKVFSRMYILDSKCPSCGQFFGVRDMIKLQNQEDEYEVAKRASERYTKKRELTKRMKEFGGGEDDD